MNVNSLLPIEAITPELLEKIALMVIEADKGLTPDNPPAFWNALVGNAKEACQKNNGFWSLVDTYREEANMRGGAHAGGVVIKLLYIGWRMAELYLTEQLEKTAN